MYIYEYEYLHLLAFSACAQFLLELFIIYGKYAGLACSHVANWSVAHLRHGLALLRWWFMIISAIIINIISRPVIALLAHSLSFSGRNYLCNDILLLLICEQSGEVLWLVQNKKSGSSSISSLNLAISVRRTHKLFRASFLWLIGMTLSRWWVVKLDFLLILFWWKSKILTFWELNIWNRTSLSRLSGLSTYLPKIKVKLGSKTVSVISTNRIPTWTAKKAGPSLYPKLVYIDHKKESMTAEVFQPQSCKSRIMRKKMLRCF